MADETMPQPVLYIEPADGQGIPMDVFTTLSRVLTLAWPDARMGPGKWGSGMSLVLPNRKAKRLSAKKVQEVVVEPDPDGMDLGVKGWDGESLSTVLPQEASDRLSVYAWTLLTKTEGAVNYVEQFLHPKDAPGKRLVWSAAWSEGQTPHELRMKAERERDEALRQVERANAAAVAAYDGNALIQQANAERDHYRDQIARVRELIEETPKSTRQRCPAVVAVEDLLHALDEDR